MDAKYDDRPFQQLNAARRLADRGLKRAGRVLSNSAKRALQDLIDRFERQVSEMQASVLRENPDRRDDASWLRSEALSKIADERQ